MGLFISGTAIPNGFRAALGSIPHGLKPDNLYTAPCRLLDPQLLRQGFPLAVDESFGFGVH